MNKIENTRNHFNSKVSTNPIEAMDFMLDGKPLSIEVFTDLYINSVIDSLELDKNSNVLDAGCGAGVMVNAMAPLVNYVEGFDLSEKLVSLYHGKEKVYVSSIEDAVITKNKFNRMVMFSVAIFFPDFNYFKNIVLKLLESLEDNGILMIGDQRVGDPASHPQYLTIDPAQLIEFLYALRYPFSIKCQSRKKRKLVKGRYDIIIYKDVL